MHTYNKYFIEKYLYKYIISNNDIRRVLLCILHNLLPIVHKSLLWFNLLNKQIKTTKEDIKKNTRKNWTAMIIYFEFVNVTRILLLFYDKFCFLYFQHLFLNFEFSLSMSSNSC